MAVATYLSAVLAISCALVGLCDSAPAAAAAADDEFSVGGAAAQVSHWPGFSFFAPSLPMCHEWATHRGYLWVSSWTTKFSVKRPPRLSLSLAQLEFQARVLVYWNKCADNLFYYLFMSSLFFADLICSHSKINFTWPTICWVHQLTQSSHSLHLLLL